MGTGGSRYGAGRPAWRRRCEHCLRFDIRQLRRRGVLQAGSSFGWHWTRDGEPFGNIGAYVGVSFLQLSYKWTPNGGEPRQMRYDVPLEQTPCRYGGSRHWFRCPWCRRRCAVLYGLSGDGHFACRLCMRLGYATESEDTCGRLWRKQRKLEAGLGENYERPKGMRHRTYERIWAQIEAVEEARDQDFMLRALAMLRRSGRL